MEVSTESSSGETSSPSLSYWSSRPGEEILDLIERNEEVEAARRGVFVVVASAPFPAFEAVVVGIAGLLTALPTVAVVVVEPPLPPLHPLLLLELLPVLVVFVADEEDFDETDSPDPKCTTFTLFPGGPSVFLFANPRNILLALAHLLGYPILPLS